MRLAFCHFLLRRMAMALRIQDAGEPRDIAAMWVRQAGVLRKIRNVKVMDGGVIRPVASFVDPLTVSDGSASASGNSSTLTTDSVSASPSGGTSPYSYAWSLIASGGGNASTASNPTMATTTFTKSGLPPEVDVTDEWRCTVTDGDGTTAAGTFLITFSYLTGR